MKLYTVIFGSHQYSHLAYSRRTEVVNYKYFNDINGFDEDFRDEINRLEINKSINKLESLYDVMIVRIL